MARFVCKTCGGRSPAGIGYVAAPGQGRLPAPDPDCRSPHFRRSGSASWGLVAWDYQDARNAIDIPGATFATYDAARAAMWALVGPWREITDWALDVLPPGKTSPQ